jgi:P27 family predicted phage terminase small subunit
MKGRHIKPDQTLSGENPIGSAPDYLKPESRRLYCKLASDLSEVVTSLDTHTLAAYCQCHQRWVEAEELVNKEGITVNGKLNPAVKVASDMVRQMRYYGSELGLSPLARGRIQVEPTTGEEELDLSV